MNEEQIRQLLRELKIMRISAVIVAIVVILTSLVYVLNIRF